VNTETIERSVQVLRDSRVSSMFRTTVVPGLVGEDDILTIARWLSGAPVFQIQQFSPLRTLDPAFAKVAPYKPEEIRRMAEIAKPHFGEVRIEGI
jgi:pyruvate-formate lyase-activating enzyme